MSDAPAKKYIVTETRTRQVAVDVYDADCQDYGEPQAALVKALDYENESLWGGSQITWAITEQRPNPT